MKTALFANLLPLVKRLVGVLVPSKVRNRLIAWSLLPYSGKIWRALNLAKWRKKVVFWYWRNLNLAIWNCTCDAIIFTLWRNRSAWRDVTLARRNWEWRLWRSTGDSCVQGYHVFESIWNPTTKIWTACEKGQTPRIPTLWVWYVEMLLLAMSPERCQLLVRYSWDEGGPSDMINFD